MAACTRSSPHDPEVVRLVEAITQGEKCIEWSDDAIVAPAPLADLIRLGPAAVPTLLDMLQTPADGWTRAMLFEAIGHIGDPRAREPLERLLARPTREIPDGALPALVRLGQPQSIPALRALLARPDRGGFGHAELLGALLSVGDDSVVEPLIDLALRVADERFDAVHALAHHASLRQALGMQEAPEFVLEDDLFLRAAKEWSLEQRGEPSPWKPHPGFNFQEPFAAEKQQAFELVAGTRRVGEGGLRCLPVDVACADTAPSEPLAVLFGWGHAQSLYLDVWQPHGATVRLHRFSTALAARHSEFDGDDMQPGHKVAEVPIHALQRMLAGAQAALSTRVVSWWWGPDGSGWMSSSNFAVALVGTNLCEATPGFCGYESSTGLPAYATLAAARDWHRRVAGDCDLRPAIDTDDDRRLFADFWQRSRERWNDEAWWFVRERMVAMAGAFGDASLVPGLLDYLQPRFAEGPHSMSRTAAHACSSLASLTGTDLRFDATGSPRPVPAVARDYLDLLDKK